MQKITVGVFDSGIGGLTVLHACRRLLPSVRFLYFGDNAHAPYGSRSPEEIAAFTARGVLALRRRGADAVVLACNTATAVCIDELRSRFRFPIIGTEPAVLPAVREAGRVLLLCTPATARSRRLADLISRCPPGSVDVLPAPLLAGEIERAVTEGTERNLAEFLPPPPNGTNAHAPHFGYGGVVLGCTHYLYDRAEIEAFYGLKSYHGNDAIARHLAETLHFGIFDHQKPSDFDQNCPVLPPVFLGKAKKKNKAVYFTNKCFQNN